MKKGTKIFITSLAVCTSLGALIATAKMSQLMLNALYSRPETLNCSYYFNSENGFTPISTINEHIFSGSAESSYKSWGTVTEQWEYNGLTSTYVQSTDKYGNSAAICLYGCNTPASSYPIGSVIEFEFTGSNIKSYYNLPEITSLTSIVKAYDKNPSPVKSLKGDSYWSDGYTSSSSYFDACKELGPVRVRLEGVTLTTQPYDSKNATIRTSNGYDVPLYFANVGSFAETSSSIDTALQNIGAAGAFTIYGYLNPYYKNGTTNALQLLVRNTFDIVPTSFTRDSDVVQSVSLPENAKTIYELNEMFEIDSLLLNMRDGSQREADFVEFSGYDMSNASTYDLNANYLYFAGTDNELAGNTAREFAKITVNNGGSVGTKVPTSLEVWSYSLKTEYNVGDNFVYPIYVFVTYSDGTSENVSDQCSYYNNNLSMAGTYNVLVTYSENGVTVSTTYEITVSGSTQKQPSYIELIHTVTEFNVGDEFIYPIVYLYYTDGSYIDISIDVACDGYDMNTAGTYTVEVSYFAGEFYASRTYTITVSSSSQSNTITFSSSITSGTYSTGNYGTKSSNGYEFIYYRTTDFNGGVANLLPAICDYGDPMGGSIANVNPFSGVDSITIKYSNTSKSGATAGKLSYGDSNTLDGSFAIPYSTSENTVTFDIAGGANFIKIESGSTQLALKEFTVHYTNSGSSSYTPISAYTNNYRINPNKYTGTLVAGSSSVTVPVSVSYSGNRYTVLQSKTYTYYTLDYVESHPSVASAAVMTDPVDVANYYSIFGEIPANYGGSGSGMNSVSDVQSVFGSDARQVSYYNRTNGYATAVPNINASQGYYEFDIALDSSYYPSGGGRGVGRVVAWIKGINNSAYGNGNYRVCHFTDDHYATFQEFNNLGQFLSKFDAQQHITGKKWSCPNTAYAA